MSALLFSPLRRLIGINTINAFCVLPIVPCAFIAKNHFASAASEPPKRPERAFILFRDEKLAEVQSTLPKNANNAEVFKEVFRLWKLLPEDKRDSLVNESKKKYAEYREQCKVWKAALSVEEQAIFAKNMKAQRGHKKELEEGKLGERLSEIKNAIRFNKKKNQSTN